ncbi:hypothetical protein QMA0248_1988 [Streptococcus iniae]|nr:hypothetical protein QMA0248_1988 [Streptococcus iniae]ATX38694.1 hypothetical protein CTW00_00453 [Streptococcus iniae]ESR09613.1 hypothetical protein IUSA1_05960 [Streptococcus iniae IUSA1]
MRKKFLKKYLLNFTYLNDEMHIDLFEKLR